MEDTKNDKPSGVLCRMFALAGGALVLAVLSAVVAVIVVRSSMVCTGHIKPSLHFDKERPEWDRVERLNIYEKNVTVVRTEGSDRCFVTPLNPTNEQRAYSLIHEPLSDEMLEEIAGPYAVMFCADQETYLLRELHTVEHGRRVRRQTPEQLAAAQAAFQNNEPGLNLEYEQRTPRCMDLVLDCAADGAVGQVRGCYTWVNGVIKMNQKCNSETSFSISMSKPPGRILKIAQQQWKICVQRRKEGLRC